LGLYICTIAFGLDVPAWTWRKRNQLSEEGYPDKNIAWAVTGGIGLPATVYIILALVIPAFQNSIQKAQLIAKDFEGTKSPTPPASEASWSPPEESFDDFQNASNAVPEPPAGNRRVYGKSGAYSLILPIGWDENNHTTPFDFIAINKSLVFEVAYFKESSKTESELLEILKVRLKKDGAAGFTETFQKEVNGINWIGFSSVFSYKGKLSGNHTCLINKNFNGVFILMFGSALQSENETQPIFDPIVESFKIE
jgi:hypothetical protein